MISRISPESDAPVDHGTENQGCNQWMNDDMVGRWEEAHDKRTDDKLETLIELLTKTEQCLNKWHTGDQ